ncbi:DUF2461 domain-containing protein [Flavobacterium caeni]|uniref:TIGR02453 family protein n=1 Tax=Flavobacterium caeni TaxID=490189 RepID=A0A1G5FUZ3_9FLAO|nr:DUF2461 domain-containing protein [Flavobacterium caeni]SCY43046.1 TIGR02453 family protein [Flavobacterium caeni]
MIPKENLEFLKDVKKNNNREWFLANKKRYEAYKKNYHQLAQQLLDAMVEKDPSLASMQVKDVVFRINRDIRFSKDKSPYKTNMAFWFSPGNKNWNQSGYYIHVEPGMSFIAGGFYQPEAPALKKIRKEIAFFHDELEEMLADKKFQSVFGDLDRTYTLKTTPKDYDKDHPAIELLKLKSFEASTKISDAELTDKHFVANMVEKLMLLKPMNAFFNRAVEAED